MLEKMVQELIDRYEKTGLLAGLNNLQVMGMAFSIKSLAEKYAAQQQRELDACLKCGQVPNGQGGEYPCSVCGIPVMHDEAVRQ